MPSSRFQQKNIEKEKLISTHQTQGRRLMKMCTKKTKRKEDENVNCGPKLLCPVHGALFENFYSSFPAHNHSKCLQKLFHEQVVPGTGTSTEKRAPRNLRTMQWNEMYDFFLRFRETLLAEFVGRSLMKDIL